MSTHEKNDPLAEVEQLYEHGKLNIWAMNEEEFAAYRREIAQAVRGIMGEPPLDAKPQAPDPPTHPRA